ncbi:hypothetical protein D210916BOD24_01670 [Alteromonas sp. D210916BOD_24]|uniref:hypothetical protein n=1 Tax=Alteromonas sp. D210916BOD_24 TaxID=3157618 RepID=UPI00399D1B64
MPRLATVCCPLLLATSFVVNPLFASVNPPENKTNTTSAIQEISKPSSPSEVTQASDTDQGSEADSSVHNHPHEEQWFDIWQRSFTDTMDFTVKQLDGLFDSSEINSNKQARAEGRIQFAWEPRTGALSETDLRFRIRVRLPALEERVDLLLSDNEDENRDTLMRATRSATKNDRDRTTIALRFRPQQDSHYSFRLGAGRRDQLYAKARYRDAQAFNKNWALLYDAEIYYYTRDRLGAEAGLALQYEFNKRHMVRQNNRFYFRDDSNDWLWRHEVHHLYSVDAHNAIIPHFMVEGLSQPNYRVEEVYAGMRWRNNTLRDWLFFEVEPFFVWLREEDFKTSYGIALRVEAYYGKDN